MDEAAKTCDVGVTTAEIDRIVHEACIERDCYPSPLNYYQFPASCCTSVNEVICHGIPDTRPLQDGDICNGTCLCIITHYQQMLYVVVFYQKSCNLIIIFSQLMLQYITKVFMEI